MLDALLLILGLVLLLAGADLLIRGASSLAARFGVPPLVIGLTVIAFGTSTPEVAINTTSAFKGQTELAFGNIVGSCLVNIGFVLGLTALVRPLTVQVSVISREIPMLMLAAAALLVLNMDFLNPGAGAGAGISRQDGILLLMLFGVFLYYTVVQVIQSRSSDAVLQDVAQSSTSRPPRRQILIEIGMLVGGLIAVIAGGDFVVRGAVSIAQRIGIPETVIGLTIVSLGTTLPELVTGIAAVRKGVSDIAVGNVVGSCIFNILLIGGLVPTISPVALPRGGMIDLLALMAFAALLLPICLRGPRRVTRAEGIFLMLFYGGYATFRFMTM